MNKKGFTLVEVIVTLTILAIVSSTVVPSFTGFIDEGQRRKCNMELAAIAKQYQIERELVYHGGEETTDAEGFLKKAVEAYGGSYSGGMSFVGPCGTAGCKAVASEDGTALLSIKCPAHSGEVTPYEIGCATLETIVRHEVLDGYFDLHCKKGTASLDSNGVNFAPKVVATLEELGLDQSNCEWRAYLNRDTDTLEMYWTDTCLDAKAEGRYRFVKYTYKFSTKELLKVDTGTCGVMKKSDGQVTFTTMNVGSSVVKYDKTPGESWPEVGSIAG